MPQARFLQDATHLPVFQRNEKPIYPKKLVGDIMFS
jgi:hypothetical protein